MKKAIIVLAVLLFWVWLAHVMGSEKQMKADYQLYIFNDTLKLFDGDRCVGVVVDTSFNSPLGKLILQDNE